MQGCRARARHLVACPEEQPGARRHRVSERTPSVLVESGVTMAAATSADGRCSQDSAESSSMAEHGRTSLRRKGVRSCHVQVQRGCSGMFDASRDRSVMIATRQEPPTPKDGGKRKKRPFPLARATGTESLGSLSEWRRLRTNNLATSPRSLVDLLVGRYKGHSLGLGEPDVCRVRCA
jgi:hypothetical protein